MTENSNFDPRVTSYLSRRGDEKVNKHGSKGSKKIENTSDF